MQVTVEQSNNFILWENYMTCFSLVVTVINNYQNIDYALINKHFADPPKL